MIDHLIKRQVLDITLPRRERAIQMQEDIRVLYWERIVPQLEQLFSRLVPEDVVIQIESLEIDLGNVKLVEIEDRVLEAITKRIENVLREKQEVKGQNNGINLRPGISRSKFEVEAKMVSSQQAKQQALFTFLKTGIFPWWVSVEKPFQELPSLVEEVLEKRPSELLEFLQTNASENLVKRLINQLPINVLLQILRVKNPAKAQVLLELQTFLEAQRSANIDQTQWRRSLQEIITYQLALSIVNPRASQGNEISIKELHNILEALAQRVSIPVVTLIQKPLLSETSKSWRASWRTLQEQSKEADGKKKLDISAEEIGLTLVEKKESTESSPKESPVEKKSPKNRIEPHRQILEEKIIDIKQRDASFSKALQEGVHVENAGLVLLSPFLKPFFQEIGLLKENEFVSPTEQERAVLLLQYLATGQLELPEQDLLLNKLLVAWPLEQAVASRLNQSEKEKTEAHDLLQAVVKHWAVLGKTTDNALRETFLQRDGKLLIDEFNQKLYVERKGVDVLLESLPWAISVIKLPWMPQSLQVEW